MGADPNPPRGLSIAVGGRSPRLCAHAILRDRAALTCVMDLRPSAQRCKLSDDRNAHGRRSAHSSNLSRWDPFECPTRVAPVPAGTTTPAWEDIMVNATDYRAMAAEQHRYAGMCWSPESRERHLGLEQQLLALAKLQESSAKAAAVHQLPARIEDQPTSGRGSLTCCTPSPHDLA